MSRSFGVDLGTTNSVISVVEAGQPEVVVNLEGARTTPSVVAFSDDGELLVGEFAKRQAVSNPDRTFRSFKRNMGSDVRYDVGGRELSPQELSARVLLKLKSDAEAQLGVPVEEITLSVPAYFSDAARQATLEAARIAGLSVVRLIPEPTAAALSFGVDRAGEGTVLVFDLGGGTLDVSALSMAEGRIEVLSVSGDADLGGDDFDEVLVKHLLAEVEASCGVDVSGDLSAMQRLRDAAENVKIELSTLSSAAVNLPFLASNDGSPVHFSTSVSRMKFEELSSGLVDRIVDPVRRVLDDLGVNGRELDHVLLVGGSSRTPAVRERLSKVLSGRKLSSEVNADEAVSLGASLQSAVLSGEVKDVLLLDVTPLSLGVETKGGLTFSLVERNITVPLRRREMFTTDVDNQDSVNIRVVQGQRALSADNRVLGEFVLGGIPAAPRGVPEIAVVFDIDADGVLTVTAEESSSGVSRSLTIAGGSALPDDEVERMLSSAQAEAERDLVRRSEAMVRNQCDSLLYEAESLVHTSSSSEALASEVERVSSAAGSLRYALSGSDFDLIAKRRTELLAAYQSLVSAARSSLADSSV